MAQVFRRYLVATLAVVGVLVLAYALYRLRIVALLFAIAGLLAYFLSWPIERLARRWPRSAAVATVFVAFLVLLTGLFGAIISVIRSQLQELGNSLPQLIYNLESSAAGWNIQLIPGREFQLSEYLVNLGDELEQSAPAVLANILDFTQTFVTGTAVVLAAMLIIPLLTLYLLLDSQRLRRSLVGTFAAHLQGDVDRALTAVNKSLGGYMYGRLLLALFVGITTTLVLLLFRVEFALLLGLLAFAGEFIPVFGPWMAFFPAALIILATNPLVFVPVALFVIGIQLVENYVIVPKLFGHTMDLHPLTVILALMIGGTLGGVAGLLVAVPAAAAAKVILGVFVFRREEPGIDVPELEAIGVTDKDKESQAGG